MSTYAGSCSDCGKVVSTGAGQDGLALSCQATAHPKLGAVYLLCTGCYKQREKDPFSNDWRPGKYHDVEKIVIHP